MSTIKPHHKLTIDSGNSELSVINMGSGATSYTIKQGSGDNVSQQLEGPGAQQFYENVQYPIKIKNNGKNTIKVSS